jgi:hypothetical protein
MADEQDTTPVMNFTTPDGVALKEHLESRIEAQRVYFEAVIAALEKATVIAAGSMEKRLDGMNEFRDALQDQAGRMATMTDVNLKIDKATAPLCVRIDQIEATQKELRTFKDQLTGRASASAVYISYALVGLSIALNIINMLTR